MDTEDAVMIGLLLGILLMVAVVVVVGTVFEWDRVENADAIESPEYVFIVEVDGNTFTCEKEPQIYSNGVGLVNCQELFGVDTLIKNYSSFSFKVRNVE